MYLLVERNCVKTILIIIISRSQEKKQDRTMNVQQGLHPCFHHSQVTDLNSRLHSVAERSRSEREELMDQLHHLAAENASDKLDNQRLKVPSGKSDGRFPTIPTTEAFTKRHAPCSSHYDMIFVFVFVNKCSLCDES